MLAGEFMSPMAGNFSNGSGKSHWFAPVALQWGSLRCGGHGVEPSLYTRRRISEAAHQRQKQRTSASACARRSSLAVSCAIGVLRNMFPMAPSARFMLATVCAASYFS